MVEFILISPHAVEVEGVLHYFLLMFCTFASLIGPNESEVRFWQVFVDENSNFRL